jgi:hypothetical protein
MPRSKRKANTARVHDRKAIVQAPNAEVCSLIVDDPYEPGGKIAVIGSFRDYPLLRLYARKQIDKAQFDAGDKYQKLCEWAEVTPVKAMDPTKEPVDGRGAIKHPYSDRQKKAASELARLDAALGKAGQRLCRQVLTERRFFGDIAAQQGMTEDAGSRYFGLRFRECLEILAIELGYAPPKRLTLVQQNGIKSPSRKICA